MTVFSCGFRLREAAGIMPVYKMIDTCASEFESYIPYFYSTYEEENESVVSDRKKIVVLGSGPIRIGQGVEFDYSTVHAVNTIPVPISFILNRSVRRML